MNIETKSKNLKVSNVLKVISHWWIYQRTKQQVLEVEIVPKQDLQVEIKEKIRMENLPSLVPQKKVVLKLKANMAWKKEKSLNLIKNLKKP